MRYILPIIFLLLGTVCAEAQIEIKVEKRLQLEAVGDANVWIWSAPLPLITEQRGSLLFVDGPPSAYRVSVTGLTIDWENKVFTQQNGYVDVVLGKSVDPKPDDPDPVDPPSDAPFPAPGLTVVIVSEVGDIGTLPPSQRVIFGSGDHRVWLDEITEGRSRFWDDDETDFQYTADYLEAGFKVAKKDMTGPWVAISNGKTGTSQALPQTVDELKALVEKYR